jgi:hypothetical protein
MAETFGEHADAQRRHRHLGDGGAELGEALGGLAHMRHNPRKRGYSAGGSSSGSAAPDTQ